MKCQREIKVVLDLEEKNNKSYFKVQNKKCFEEKYFNPHFLEYSCITNKLVSFTNFCACVV